MKDCAVSITAPREESMRSNTAWAPVALSLLVAGALASISAEAPAQDYPSRPIHIISQTPAGGSGDVVTRLFADFLSKAWKQTVVVENKPGGGGAVAALFVAHAEPDGYTLFVSTPTITAFRIFQKTVDFDIDRDLTPISLLITTPYLVAVNAGVPSRTLAEFIAYTKANPGKVSYSGFGSGQMMAIEWLKQKSGADLVADSVQRREPRLAGIDLQRRADVVPFAGLDAAVRGAPARSELLAVTSRSRLNGYPDVPTVAGNRPRVRGRGVVRPARSKRLPRRYYAQACRRGCRVRQAAGHCEKLGSLGVQAARERPRSSTTC